MQVLENVVDALSADKTCVWLSRPHLAFLTVMTAYRTNATLAVTQDDAASIKTAVISFLSAGTPAEKAIRMQVAFYVSYTAARRALDERAGDRRRRLHEAEREVDAIASNGDIAKMTVVYKHLLDYCTASSSADAALSGSKPAKAIDVLQYITAVQREFATALESVLPKSGVQGFLQMPKEERTSQMEELSRLVVGIRLFNWESGKGGAGLEHTPSLSASEARSLATDAQQAMDASLALCKQYVAVLSAVQADSVTASAQEIQSWSSELVNRRAAAVLLAAVLEDATALSARLTDSLNGYQSTLADLKKAIGGKAAISKDAVYPFFSRMAANWLASAEGRAEVGELRAVLEALRSYTPGSTASSLPFDKVLEVQRAGAAGARISASFAPASQPPAEESPAQRVDPRQAASLGLGLDMAGMCPVALTTPVHGSPAGSGLGVLQPGDPQYGLYRYQDRLFAVSSEEAGQAFAAAPARYLQNVRAVTVAGHPELVHMLDLLGQPGPLTSNGASFPVASLQLLASFDGDVQATAAAVAQQAGPAQTAVAASETMGVSAGTQASDLSSTARLGATGRVSKHGRALVDVGVETPVHFVERHIGPDYHFSEWALRRQALRIANIRKSATHGAQTDGSSFRRDNDTQVYLPRESGTQTGISVGSNTDRVVRYVGGLRGYQEPFVDAAAANIGQGKPALAPNGSKTQPVPGPTNAMRIISATLDV